MKFLEFINKILRPFSMYKGMSLGLIGIWLVALIFSFVGLLDFSPLALVLSMLVLVLSTYGASRLYGWLFGVKPHGESSLITGLILALIFLPVDTVPQLVVLAFVGMIAGASKFIITWRGRHIFNPAALAAVVIGLTGLGAATWWVATPILTPVVLAVAVIFLYQSKRYWVTGTFLAITIPVLVIQFMGFGTTFGEALWLLMAWPILFLSTVMLTEPLTLPPRKWQMYTVAAVVAVLFLLPIKFGSIAMTPALALVLGNIVALVFAHRRAIRLTFKERRSLTPTTDEVVFSVDTPVPYLPGQYMELYIPHQKMDFRGSRRSFSVTSIPQAKEVSFAMKFYEPSSSFKKKVKTLQAGDTLAVTQVGGDFVLPKDSTRPLLFIAGGIGVTPFIAHLRWLQEEPVSRDITLVYAVSSAGELAYVDVLKKSGARIIIVAPEKPANIPDAWQYVQGTRIDFDTIAESIGDLQSKATYISGPTPFVQRAKHALRGRGVRWVKTDYFVGY